MLRKILAVIAGAIAGYIVITGIELTTLLVNPLPAGLDFSDEAAMRRWVESAPFAAQAIVVLAWFIGTFVGAWVARSIAREAATTTVPAGWIVAGLALLGSVVNLFQFPHPLWMQVAAVAAPLLGGWLATKAGGRPKPA